MPTNVSATHPADLDSFLHPDDAPVDNEEVFGNVLRQALITIFFMKQDEFVLLLTCIIPLWYGVVAALKTVTGNTSASGATTRDIESSDFHTHRFHLALTNIARHNKETSNEMLNRLETQATNIMNRLAELEQTHDSRYVELHRDVACVYWEMSRLRTDFSNLQHGDGTRRPAPTLRSDLL